LHRFQLSYGLLLVKFSLATRECHRWGDPCKNPDKLYVSRN